VTTSGAMVEHINGRRYGTLWNYTRDSSPREMAYYMSSGA